MASMEEIWAYLQRMGMDTPEAQQEFALAGLTPEQMALQQGDYELGQGMMQTPSAQGQNVGGTYVAANPLEHLAAAIGRSMGVQKMKGARSEQDRLLQALSKWKGRQIGAEGGGPNGPPMQPEPVVPQTPQPIDQMWPGVPYPMP